MILLKGFDQVFNARNHTGDFASILFDICVRICLIRDLGLSGLRLSKCDGSGRVNLANRSLQAASGSNDGS